MWQLETLLFASSYIWLAYIFQASYNMVVTSGVKNQVSTNQNSRNRWCLIVRRTICILLIIKFITFPQNDKNGSKKRSKKHLDIYVNTRSSAGYYT